MQNREVSVSILAEQMTTILEDKDKLALRASSKGYCTALHKAQSGPYISKTEFIIGVSERFHDDKYLNAAWYVYNSTVWSFSQLPAMLYKLTDMKKIASTATLTRFAQGEHLNDTGRLYSPGDDHAWDVNQVWLLAQMHVSRPFVVFSALTDQHVMRRHDQAKYSAFAKEIAVVIKAGYDININADGWMQLNPPEVPNTNLTIEDLDLSNVEIRHAIQKFNNSKILIWIINEASHIKYLFNSIETATLADLQKIEVSYADLIDQHIDGLLLNNWDKKLVGAVFLHEYNKDRPDAAPELIVDDFLLGCRNRTGLSFFMHAQNEFGVKAKIAAAFLDRLEILTQSKANQVSQQQLCLCS